MSLSPHSKKPHTFACGADSSSFSGQGPFERKHIFLAAENIGGSSIFAFFDFEVVHGDSLGVAKFHGLIRDNLEELLERSGCREGYGEMTLEQLKK
ncbi:unnamed protein product [Bursaphelenchus xylophilus]|uniref:(pine wood nematode) hypothetical protein n=1 Tax=Bursaphelenchus xylophilus TaxID=6326 RepID=A0A7I8XLQ0_BURXY|nr:unnamed protein product [Bursaphelenchus xylophilus]CAG9086788.1 unnamed protein product [Bursaphelenchus xylophilus]